MTGVVMAICWKLRSHLATCTAIFMIVLGCWLLAKHPRTWSVGSDLGEFGLEGSFVFGVELQRNSSDNMRAWRRASSSVQWSSNSPRNNIPSSESA